MSYTPFLVGPLPIVKYVFNGSESFTYGGADTHSHVFVNDALSLFAMLESGLYVLDGASPIIKVATTDQVPNSTVNPEVDAVVTVLLRKYNASTGFFVSGTHYNLVSGSLNVTISH